MKSHLPPGFRITQLRPPRIAMGLTLLALAAGRLFPVTLWQAPAWLAVSVAGLGLAIMLRAWWLFQRAATPICPADHATVLITNEVYAFSRNPMYLGLLAMLAGGALLVGSVSFYLAAVIFFLVIDRAFCPFEEHRLQASFGTVYAEYRRRVRRWL